MPSCVVGGGVIVVGGGGGGGGLMPSFVVVGVVGGVFLWGGEGVAMVEGGRGWIAVSRMMPSRWAGLGRERGGRKRGRPRP